MTLAERKAVWLRALLTLAIAGVGGGTAFALGVPAGLLMGGALAVTVAALSGVKTVVPDTLRDTIFVFIGMSMGATVAQDSLALAVQWPITLTVLVIELVIIVMACGFLLIKVFDLDRGTAYLSSFPGHLSFIIGIASAGVGDARQILIIQVLRVMLLTIFAPIGAIFLPIGSYGDGAAAEVMSPTTFAFILLGCVAVGHVFVRLNVPAGYVLGSMAFATIMKLTGNFHGAMPPLLVDATFLAMGALIGSRFAGVRRAEIMVALKGGLAATVLTVAIVTVIAYGLTFAVDMPFGQLWLGLSPGGLESMGALGIALGYDTAFIAVHHVFRLLILSFAIPVVTFLVRERIP